MKNFKKTSKIIIALVILAVLIVGAFALYNAYMPEGVQGDKHIAVEIIHGDGTTKDIAIITDSENLRGALEQEEGLVDGNDSEFGLFVTTVDGETADSAAQEWWCFTKGGEMLNTGVDDTMIQDGEHYEITFTVGW